MKRLLSFALCVVLMASFSFASTEGDRAKLEDRLDDAATIMNEIMSAPDKGIPEEVLNSAQCVAVVPSMIKASLGFGGQYGQGVVTCRTQAGWSAPAFYRLSGGSFGIQIGGQAVDLVMLIMNRKGMEHLMSSKFKLGADATVAAGPVGRHAAADTDWKMRAQVLSYSRARGVFAGLELNGAVVKMDRESTLEFYGHIQPVDQTLATANNPTGALPFLTSLSKWAKIASK